MRVLARWGVWTLRSHLSALLMLSLLLTLVAVGGVVLAYGIPTIAQQTQRTLDQEVHETAQRVELLLGTRQTRLVLLSSMLQGASPQSADAVLDKGVRQGGVLRVVYRVSREGKVVAVGLPEALQARRTELLGSDLSAHPLFRAVGNAQGVVWSGKYRSMLTGELTAALAVRDHDGQVLIAEVPLDVLLGAVTVAAGEHATSIWVVDAAGDIIADTDQGRHVGTHHLPDLHRVEALLQRDPSGAEFRFEGERFHAALARSARLDWHFLARAPTGLQNTQVRSLVLFVAVAFLASVCVGLMVAPFWANHMVRPLRTIIARAAQTTAGAPTGMHWPRGPVAEFNRLSGDIQQMAYALEEREHKFLAIFNAAPVPMVVVGNDDAARLLDVNEAWCRDMCHAREDVVGRNAWELGLWSEPEKMAMVLERVTASGTPEETWMVRGDGSQMLVQLFSQRVALASGPVVIGASVDIGPIRHAEQALRDLNLQLEQRVARRSQALAAANRALSENVTRLRMARGELVRTEKMAALGSLVAGVAHELNTPLGNGVMAVSAMSDTIRQFQAAMQSGLRRSALQQLVDSVQQGTDIAGRNLHRAAELVQSFKQVAVDQSSAQRRSFELHEAVHEMVVSLRPSLSRTHCTIVVDVPRTGMRMDSYPGALGQVLGNLVQNAVVHGLEGHAQGTVRISAVHNDDGTIALHVADTGRGIAPAIIGRIFEPFFTTRKGLGGTGLGLHISYNAVTHLLGGSITVHSVEGEGTRFEMRLPVSAPDTVAAAA